MDTQVNTVYFVDDERHIRGFVSQILTLQDYNVETFSNAEDVLPKLHRGWPGVLITDINMPKTDGLTLADTVLKMDNNIPVILLTGHGDISMAVSAIRRGIYDFIEKPFDNDHFLDVVRRALEKRQLTLEVQKLKTEVDNFSAPGPRLLGNSKAITQLRDVIYQVSDTSADILLHGETGTGKDLVARYLHHHSSRQNKNFVAINCGALPENIIESELFGYEAGAFTGADKRRTGKFEYANGGTIFLDEIESMPLALQVKFLRILEERAIVRLGSNELVPLDIRVIAATKSDLLDMSNRQEFRSDLFYRLNLVTIPVPPLRDRTEDISLLFLHFAREASARHQRELIPVSQEQMTSMLQHNWPGNVRELKNQAERYVLLGDTAFDNSTIIDSNLQNLDCHSTLQESMDSYERALIANALQKHNGRIKDVMVTLGLPRKTLYDRMKKHGLDRKDFVSG